MNYTIKNEYLTAEINLYGGELKSLVYNGKEYMLNDKKYWGYTSPYLFPVIGKLLDGYTVIEGNKYEIPKHGLVRNANFELLEHKDDEISVILKSNRQFKDLYPYEFSFIITYKVVEKKLHTFITVKNEDSKDMCFNLGLHPAFILEDHFENYKIEFENKESSDIPSVEGNGTINFLKTYKKFDSITELPLKYNDYEVDALLFTNCASSSVKLLNKENKGILFNFNDFPNVAFWTPNSLDAPFICIEPWIGYPSKSNDSHEFLNKDQLICVKSQDYAKFSYYFEIID